jgi:hypothetical protein
MIRLTVLERIILFAIVPRQGSFNHMDLAQGIIQQIHFPPSERAELELIDVGGKVEWNEDKEADHEKEIELDVGGVKLIQDALAKMSDAGELPMDGISLYRKFLLPGPTVVDSAEDEGEE